MEKILSIAIPTYNRSNYLDICLRNICSQINNHNNDIELLVSDNCSTDNTSDIVNSYLKRGYEIKYIKNTSNIGADGNFLQCFNLSSGKYLHIISDDDVLLPGSLDVILSVLKKSDYGVVYLNSYGFSDNYLVPKKKRKIKNNIVLYEDKFKFINDFNIMFTFISGNIVNKKYVKNFIDNEKLLKSNLIQFYWFLSAIINSSKNMYINYFCIAAKINNSGGYSVAKVFGVNLFEAIDLFKLNGLPICIEKKFKKVLLSDYLPKTFIKQRYDIGMFKKEDNFKILYPIHKNNIYFWAVTAPVIKLPKFIANIWRNMSINILKTVNNIRAIFL